MRRVLRALFERGGLRVAEAGSAAEALKVVDDAQDIAAVVCDVIMPGTSGLALYEQLLGRAPALRGRVVFLSGAAHDPTVHAPIEQLNVPLISKLDDLRLVVDAVRLALLPRHSA